MPQRHKPTPQLRSNFPAWLAIVIICVITVLGWVSHLAAHHKQGVLASEVKRLEQEIEHLQKELLAVERRIDLSLAREQAGERLASLKSRLHPVRKERIIVLTPPPQRLVQTQTPLSSATATH